MPVFVKTEWLVAKYLCILNEGNIRELKEKKKLSQGSQPHDGLLSWKTRITVLLSAKMFVLTSYYTFFCSCKQESRVLMRLGEGIHLNPKRGIKEKGNKWKKEKRRKRGSEGGGWQELCMKIWRLPYGAIASCQKRLLTQLLSTPFTFWTSALNSAT